MIVAIIPIITELMWPEGAVDLKYFQIVTLFSTKAAKEELQATVKKTSVNVSCVPEVQ